MTLSLVVLAGGKSQRFGRSKQLEPVGPNNETLLEYSIYDALRSGFSRAVIVTSPENLDALESSLQHLHAEIELRFAVQETVSVKRSKPLGTAHAVLPAAKFLDGPFAVLNADDFYGDSAFRKAADFLAGLQAQEGDIGLLAYELRNTIHNENPVSRALCVSSDEGRLAALTELSVSQQDSGGFAARDSAGTLSLLSGSERISMNFWAMPPAILTALERACESFLADEQKRDESEFALPDVIQSLSESDNMNVRLIFEDGETFGLSYPSDREGVVTRLTRLHQRGEYPTPCGSRTSSRPEYHHRETR